ncbi:unnamed protein product [Symbiodinium microadriaticum]|nr:unnamed protein product [Symbiodinium microadriaticum]
MVTLAQPNLDFNPYPLDNQHIEIVMHSTSYSTAQVRLNYSDPAVLYVSTPDGKDINFEKNVIWLHESGDWHAWSERQITILGNDDTKKMYDIQTVLLRVTRESDGVVIRFMLPILALMILAGWIFWIATDQRADATMNVLVAVSAMYIVIFSNIPLVGYMTTMDIYIVEVFGVLVLCIGVHHFSMRLDSKSGKIPVRRFLIRVVEALGRMFVIPFCIFSFFILFGSGSLRVFKIPVYTGASLFAITIAVRERAGLNKEFRIMIEDIEAKKEALLLGESRELFWSEVVVYAIYNSTCCRTRNEAFRRGKSEYLNQKMSILEKIESRRSSASINEQGNPLGETNYDPSSDRVGQMGKEGVIKGEFAIETGGNDDL